jgi:hypothetical protein
MHKSGISQRWIGERALQPSQFLNKTLDSLLNEH